MTAILTTPRLTLQLWTRSDLAHAIQLWGDPQVMAFLGGSLHRSQVEQRLAQEIARQEEYGIQYWKVVDRTSGVFIGCCGLQPYHVREPGVELGFHLVSAQWGHGYATEAASNVVAYAFETLRLPKLFTAHHPHNTASQHVIAKLGFHHIGERWYAPTGLYHPEYALLNARVSEAS